ncbi:type II secretion system F family protein [Nocardioides sp. Bht2]|uniref:type II secretion system F family protein n=1 Tax=Nocardioides sp. Bht2 TaxID=3392297 RepID=UPI0039B458F2
MSGWGAVVGGAGGLGIWLLCWGLWNLRRVDVRDRVLPYVRDVATRHPSAPLRQTNVVVGVFGPLLTGAAGWIDRILGGSASVRSRLRDAGTAKTVQEFRIEQVQWGLVPLAVVAVYAVLRAISDPSRTLGLALLCAAAFVAGVVARDSWLTSQVRRRERQIMVEFPVIAELLALAVVAGESPTSALDRVVRRTRGALATELSSVLAQIRTGTPVALAFDALAARTGLAAVSRFAEGVAVAVERGTPLAEVLHAQAGDVREGARRQLIEVGARKEVAMMVPVVFFVLPVTILFAFWPGAVGLSMVTP